MLDFLKVIYTVFQFNLKENRMIKKSGVCILFLIALVLIAGCKGNGGENAESGKTESKAVKGKYGEAYALIEKTVIAQENYVNELKGVKSSEDFVKAVENYATILGELLPQMEKINEKYPELAMVEQWPEEFKNLETRLNMTAEEMTTLNQETVMKYIAEPGVKEALGKMAEVMSGADSSQE